ncbi:BRCA1-associated RING domain protein 1 isoform X2 [Megachile rotundata]|uniref:BRCA1-associated RING domain protein 1 isoform X2 n=1 Tax=Megachile rotundata TaxID=143995 RepID=UPI003FD2712C
MHSITCKYTSGNKPINAMRYTNCGHFFCSHCILNHSECVKCNTPVQPLEISNDHLVKHLVSSCDIIAELIQEKNLWNTTTTNLNNLTQISTQVSTTTEARTKVTNVNYRIPKKNIDKPNDKGETKLHSACLKNQEEHVKGLLRLGANPNTKDNAGWTPLQEVVCYGYINICKLLLECGALPNTPGLENRRALHEAALNNRLQEAEMLLKYGARKDVFDDSGKKPIDYCKAHSEMWNILSDKNEYHNTSEEAVLLNSTLHQSFSMTQSFDTIVIFASNLRTHNRKYLEQMISKHKIKTVSVFRSCVTHIIVEASQNVTRLTYDVMMALLCGCWILNTAWIQYDMDIVDILKGDLEVLELFEIFKTTGSSKEGIPKKARENAQNQNPRLFNKCHFYFAMEPKNNYHINDMVLTKDALSKLVQTGGGTVLKREPKPEDIKNKEQFINFHIANEPTHPLYKCTHYIIYVSDRDGPHIKYNMPHIKTLPIAWLIECIEQFTLVDPSKLGLLR